ncbi:hypothetical protein Vretimale_16703 [Volvox reticuliferus]|uniref:Protein kinase domain-containing protein n=3 Tax=Volvox reticuliferus TaxID=1737510 RepID=A0A8J4GUT6_9CHLO|nr:hypothetical protein Vretifemale_8537 [Volvox reticuliferus]GIM13636.1 hypothetical protein Vretimale_16703 [Volvox reticuliferus]
MLENIAGGQAPNVEEAAAAAAGNSGDDPASILRQLQSSKDLAESLFKSANHAMAGVVRELQMRTRRVHEGDAEAPGVDGQDVRHGEMELSQKLVTDLEQGVAQKPDLWVLGGASTIIDVPAAPRVPSFSKDARVKVETTAANHHVPSVTVAVNNGCKPERNRTSKRCAQGFISTWDTFKDMASIVRLHPFSTLAAPLAIFVLLAGLGVWGVLAGTFSHIQQRKDDARSQAVDAATGFQIQLEQTYTPGVTFSLLVRQHPEWEYWLANFNNTAAELMSRTLTGAIWSLQLQPFGQPMAVYPFRPADAKLLFPPRDQLTDPLRRESVFNAIRTREPQVAGPLTLGQGYLGALIRYPIFVPNVSAEDTFGFRYQENVSAIPYSDLPQSVRSCTICYNATSREKWWGLMTLVINYEAVAQGDDAYLSILRRKGFNYALVRPINSTYEEPIYQSVPGALRSEDAVTVEVKALGNVWLLRVAPAGGFAPSWTVPLIVAVLLIAMVVSALLLVAIASLRRARLLLDETVAANRNLAEAMKRLEEEKERMDVLLLRQYDLLRCLDANRAKKAGDSTDSTDSVCASKGRMMALIEDARQCLNRAKASSEDPIQLFEVLGTGAFGKVQRGIWRGTVVAVKTMILPANMTGQEKREKMAVMEAAISSSLVHPNIVTTYTYFIRPYHEPTHEGVQQMLATLSTQTNTNNMSRTFGNDPTPPPGADENVAASESTVHSYEVRLVLEYCDKGSLKDALDQHVFMQGGTFNLGAVLETAADVAKAMVHMHAANVLHSDLKARNIMLKSSGTEGRGVIAKVADFGLSTRMEHQETHLSSCFQGTLTHMAPEVMLEGRISKAADVYSFGILMWELFCGGDPFAGVPRAHIGHAITKEGRRPKFPPFAPRDYVALATRCWDPDAVMRPSFEKVLTELVRLREALGGETMPLIVTTPAPKSRATSRSSSTTSSPTYVGGGSTADGTGTPKLPSRQSGSSSAGCSISMNGGGSGGSSVAAAAPFRGLLGRSMSANGASLGTNPIILYRAGILVGDGGSGDYSMSVDSVQGISVVGDGGRDEARDGFGTNHRSSLRIHNGLSLVPRSASASDRVTRAQRERLKALVLERQMRKLGVRISRGNSVGPATSLPVLDEVEGDEEVCVSGGGGRGR